MTISQRKKLILLDRDGVINVDLPTGVRTVEEFRLVPGAASAIKGLNEAGVHVAVVTNQALVGRGEISEEDLAKIHDFMRACLKQEGARVDHIFYCTDTEIEPNKRRKPAPGMVLEALEKYQAKADETPFVGDALRDLEAAKAAGCRRYLVTTGKGARTLENLTPILEPVHVFEDLRAAVDFYLGAKEG